MILMLAKDMVAAVNEMNDVEIARLKIAIEQREAALEEKRHVMHEYERAIQRLLDGAAAAGVRFIYHSADDPWCIKLDRDKIHAAC